MANQPYKGTATDYAAETERRKAILNKMAPAPQAPPKPKKKTPYDFLMGVLKTKKLNAP